MDPVILRAVVVAVLLGAVALVGWWWQRRDGRVRTAEGHFADDQLAALGLDLRGAEGAAVLLGSPGCAPCSSVKQILGEVAAERDRFRWVDVDAAAYLDLARDHHVLRVPTLFVLDPTGRILARTSGVPAKHELEQVLDRRDTDVVPQL